VLGDGLHETGRVDTPTTLLTSTWGVQDSVPSRAILAEMFCHFPQPTQAHADK